MDAKGRVHIISETLHTIDGIVFAKQDAAANMLRHVRTSHGTTNSY